MEDRRASRTWRRGLLGIPLLIAVVVLVPFPFALLRAVPHGLAALSWTAFVRDLVAGWVVEVVFLVVVLVREPVVRLLERSVKPPR